MRSPLLVSLCCTVFSLPFNANAQSSDGLFDMCDVMTKAEVAGLSPFGRPVKKITSEKGEFYTLCHYDLESDDDYPQVHIVLSVFSSADEAKTAYTSTAGSWRDMYQRAPENINGLADSVCFLGNADPQWCDDCSLQAWSGRYFITIGFKGYFQNKIMAPHKQESAVNLLKLLFQKKPYLRGR